ncbi:restriction endonuclease subunit S [Tenggerimyces flavus]|uniref:Restriction endonuclease subunit S n=1 Tax=Tenggerimyces flavus TaxID=1708749 RepID=A0ABV7YBR8_9ACTN|nr:restriction endonuclease subunit S [Tenggerimyces flavus]MBM7785544.1 type I restriction enzyme S subunit [Tenggerimyces flavus]
MNGSVRLKWLLSQSDARAGARAETLPLLSVSISWGVRRRQESETTTRAASEDLSNYKLCRAGDLVINRMRAFQGALGIAPEDGIVSPDYAVLRVDPKVDKRWLNYLLTSGPTVATMASLVRGIGGTETGNVRTPRLNISDLQAMTVPLVSADGQRVIADYLDRETASIDTLIEEQQRLIEMLRGRRRAVVEQAVFSGLDGGPMTINAESWLPPTPSHWRVVQLGFVSDTVAGYPFPSNGFSADEDHVRLLRGVNVKPGRINWADTVYWDVEATAVPSEFVLEVGDLVFGMDRPFVGGGVRVAAVSGNDLPTLLLQRVMRIRPISEAGRGYMRYVMSTDAFLTYLEPQFTGVSVPHVSEWQVRKFKMPFPPLDEQKSIAAYLDGQTAKIDVLLEETERFIAIARERRAALVTAAVTGQIDVREMV